MLVVDATCLYEVVADTEQSASVSDRLVADPDHAAPHLIDVEVYNVIRRKRIEGKLDETAAAQAVEDLEAWPGERFGHRALLWRVWELRHSVRGWDAFYVALAEALDSELLTLDRRLGRIKGLGCRIEVLS